MIRLHHCTIGLVLLANVWKNTYERIFIRPLQIYIGVYSKILVVTSCYFLISGDDYCQFLNSFETEQYDIDKMVLHLEIWKCNMNICLCSKKGSTPRSIHNIGPFTLLTSWNNVVSFTVIDPELAGSPSTPWLQRHSFHDYRNQTIPQFTVIYMFGFTQMNDNNMWYI